MERPLLSVKTISYNHAPYIRQCMDAVLMQETDFTFEFIIGEDCSTDNTREIVKEYAKKYPDIIKLVLSDHNVGAKENSRRCLELCTGKYIAICEGDDYWTDPHKLQKQVDFLELNPDYALLHSSARVIRDKDCLGLIQDVKKVVRGDVFINLLVRDFFISTLTVCVRRDVLLWAKDSIRAERERRLWKMGDAPLWLQISNKYKIGYLSEPTAVYRLLEESASHSKSKKKSYDFFESSYDVRRYFSEREHVSQESILLIKDRYSRDILKYSRYCKMKALKCMMYLIVNYKCSLADVFHFSKGLF